MSDHNDNISVDAGFDALDYHYENHKPSGNDIAIRGERQLWCAVIHQAFLDLEDAMESAQAHRWLLRDKKDFVAICSLAGISPLAVRMAALAKVEALMAAKESD